MADVLSMEEIDRLLEALTTGDIDDIVDEEKENTMEDILKIETDFAKFIISKLLNKYINKKLNKNITLSVDNLKVFANDKDVMIGASFTAKISEDEIKKFVEDLL